MFAVMWSDLLLNVVVRVSTVMLVFKVIVSFRFRLIHATLILRLVSTSNRQLRQHGRPIAYSWGSTFPASRTDVASLEGPGLEGWGGGGD